MFMSRKNEEGVKRMITKSEAQGVTVDWEAVNKATEVPRTYLIKDRKGREFFKMYKPSEAKRIFNLEGWTGTIVSTMDRSRKKS